MESSSSSSESSGSSSSSGDPYAPIYDVGTWPEAEDPCEGKGQVEFSYIWIANSPEGTVSKIDTEDLVEEGRYITRPDGNGNPSRTSVNLAGDVAVANRNGGVTKILAAGCDDTSTGPDDVRPWPDGCVAWHTAMDYASQRPVAWTRGTYDEASCTYRDPKLWTSGANPGIDVMLLDGETGVIEESVTVDIPLGLYSLGLYGAAVDGEGNFWATQLVSGYLVRVDREDFSVSTYEMPIDAYGMTVDHEGRPWTCNVGVARFDPVAELWDVGSAMPGVGGAGCMEDAEGRLWVAGYSLMAIDIDTMDEIASYPLPAIAGIPDSDYARGVSVDFQGGVWAPAPHADAAYRLDPVTGEFESVDGLEFPYTYSDMTGFQLQHAGGHAAG